MTFFVTCAACGGGGASTTNQGTTDAAAVQDDSVVGSDSGASPDTSAPDIASADTAASCPGGSGCTCSKQTECDSGLCLETQNGKQCAQLCSATCPTGYRCAAVPQGSDIVQACVAIDARMCAPCLDNSACNPPGITDARCVPMGDAGAFCGVGCQTTADCPTGSTCQNTKDISGSTTKQCLPVDGKGGSVACTCSVNAVALGGSTTCSKSLTSEGKSLVCSGKAACVTVGQSATCQANDPAPEVCNGVDDDCDGQTDESSCDDNNACTQDNCDASAAKCTHTNLTGSCDADGSACTSGDACQNGVCVAGDVVSCDDKNPCTKDSCDAKTGCVQSPDDGKPCSDDNPCTLGDICAAGVCSAGAPKTCTSIDPCQLAKCDQSTGSCVYKTLPADAGCDDGNACTQGDSCATGDCTGKVSTCDDSNPCTIDACDKAKGCTAAANSAPCNDNNGCTTGDTCSGGACAGLPMTATVDCDDNNPCTTDACDPKDGCVHPAQAGPCDDGNPCTGGDVCEKGLCSPGLNACDCQSDADCAAKDDADLCNGKLVCVKNVCEIKANSVVVCAGGTTCAPVQCVAATGQCIAKNLADGSGCDADGSVCTAGDLCVGGACVAGKVVGCDDNNPCTTDSCDKAQGCVNDPNSLACSDGNACTQNDACVAGTCIGGPLLGCDDNNPCTTDSCDKTLGCVNTPNTLACSDDDLCTAGDVCAGGACAAGKVVDCDDNNPCTTDSCDKTLGCVNSVNTLACSDGNPCTSGDVCKAGACSPGANQCECQQNADCFAKEDGDLCNGTLVCDAVSHTCKVDAKTVVTCAASADPCKQNLCTAATGQCALVAGNDGGSCSDGDACSVGDSCVGGVCKGGAAATCDDKNPCTKDSCAAKTGCVYAPDVSVTLPCYDGPAGTQGVGACKGGAQACNAQEQLGACSDAVVPAVTEACNGIDDTCNGQTDEGCAANGWDYAVTPVSYVATGGKTSVDAVGGVAWLGSAGNGVKTVLWAVADWLKAGWQ